MGKKLAVFEARTKDELNKAFTAILEQHGRALVVDFPAAGGLVSYGTSLADALRLVGNYTGRILKGEKPGDLPIQQSVRTEFVINLKTAKALGLTVPHGLLNAAEEA